MEGKCQIQVLIRYINLRQQKFYPTTSLLNYNPQLQADYKTTKITPELKAKIARAKLRGAKPKVPFDIRNNTDVNIKAVLNAMDWCYRNDPNLRPSAAAIANGLQTALIALDADNNTEPLVEVNLKEV